MVPKATWEESNRCYLAQFDRAEALQKALDAKQAELDRVMLEHCPDEMTAEQTENWAKHQKVADPCPHPWLGDGPQPSKFDCRCGTRVYRSYEDYCWD